MKHSFDYYENRIIILRRFVDYIDKLLLDPACRSKKFLKAVRKDKIKRIADLEKKIINLKK